MLGRPYHSDPGLNHDVMQEFQALGYPILSMGAIPRDRQWLEHYFREDLAAGLPDVFDINDVWPENYSANSAFKVWCAKFAARHPNVAVFDLSSFKCGHDSPVYSTIDGILAASRTPTSALHDIDANKPGGSIAIRVRTYGYTLERHRERLEDVAHKKRELERRVDLKRAELKARYEAERLERERHTAERPKPVPMENHQPAGLVDRALDRARPAMVGLARLAEKARRLAEQRLQP
jgi:hypothetical protein